MDKRSSPEESESPSLGSCPSSSQYGTYPASTTYATPSLTSVPRSQLPPRQPPRLHNETRTAIESAAQTTNNLREELNNANKTIQKNTIEIRDNTNAAKAANIMAKETVEASKITLKMVRDKALGPMNQSSAGHTYASVAARGGLAASIHNPQNQSTSQVQTLREIIVNIRDPATIASLRAMSPRNLKTYIDHAIKQSNNEHINKAKAVSANQLKSGDLSIKAATTADMEALRQFAEDWENRIGNGATVRIPTYGVLAHGIRTKSMDMERFTELRDELLQDNKPFIPTAEIKYIGWLTRSASTKSASSVIIELSKAQDANRIIDEGLIWQGEEPSARQQQLAATARKNMRLDDALKDPGLVKQTIEFQLADKDRIALLFRTIFPDCEVGDQEAFANKMPGLYSRDRNQLPFGQ